MATINALNNASAPFTVSTGNLTVTSGNLTISAGSASASTTVTAGTNLVSTAGNLLLPTTTSSVGQIRINSLRFMHNFGDTTTEQNCFVGTEAGNFTLTAATATRCTGVGYRSLYALSTGGGNTGIGYNTLKTVSTGTNNCAFGSNALAFCNGSYNTGFGTAAGYGITTGLNNQFIGWLNGYNITTGSRNVFIGGYYDTGNYPTGVNQTLADSDNILIHNQGVVGHNNTLRIGQATGTGKTELKSSYICGIYTTAATPSGTANITLIDSNNLIYGLAGSANTLFVGGTAPSFTATPTCTDLTLTGVLKLPTTTTTVGQIQINSVPVLQTLGTNNTFVGAAGNLTFTTANATHNTATGAGALDSIVGTNTTEARYNCAYGFESLTADTSGSQNSAYGFRSGASVTTGGSNCFLGTAAGYTSITTGSFNIMLGTLSGGNYTSSESSNILIGYNLPGTAGESNVLRIGISTGTGSGALNSSYIAGIRGITTANNDAIAVLIDSAGQLGTVSSKRELKENIKDMGDSSTPVMSLRPVTFNYKTHKDKSIPNYGLIAEEVADIFPNIVVTDKEGNPETIKYHELPVILLNELQKAVKTIELLEKRIKVLEDK